MFVKEIIVRPVARLHKQAYACCEAGKVDKAIACLEKALQLCRATVGEQHQDFAFTLCHLSSMLCLKQDYDQAFSCASRALEIAVPLLGKQRAMVGHMYVCLGNVHSVQGRFEEAIACFQEAMTIQEKTLGPRHHHVSTTCNMWAMVYVNMQDYPRAFGLLQRALEVLKYSSDPDGELITSYHLLSKACLGTGDMEKSRYYLEKTERILQRTRGSNHAYTRLVQQELKTVAFAAQRRCR
ncbi:MAG: tetratricopeptide repeat protein [Myxococcota bacterium]